MSWNKWLSGLVVAALGGVFNGCLGLTVNLSWKEIGILVLVNAAKDMGLWIKNHPVDDQQPPKTQ